MSAHAQGRQAFHGATDTVPRRDRLAVEVTEAVQLKPYQTVVHATGSATTGNYTITLPSAIEAAGLIFSIWATISGGAVVTVDDAGDATLAAQTLDTNNDHVVLFCDGFRWFVLVNGIV